MIVSIANLVLTLVLLLLTIFHSRRSKIPALESSLLAVLQSLDGETGRELGGVRSPASMEERARGLAVRFESEGSEWQLVKAD